MKSYLLVIALLGTLVLSAPVNSPEYDPDCIEPDSSDEEVEPIFDEQEILPILGETEHGLKQPDLKVQIGQDVPSSDYDDDEDCEDPTDEPAVDCIENPEADGCPEINPCDANPCGDNCPQNCLLCPQHVGCQKGPTAGPQETAEECEEPEVDCSSDSCQPGCAQDCTSCPHLPQCAELKPDPCKADPCSCDSSAAGCQPDTTETPETTEEPTEDPCEADPCSCDANAPGCQVDKCDVDACAEGCEQPCSECPSLAKCNDGGDGGDNNVTPTCEDPDTAPPATDATMVIGTREPVRELPDESGLGVLIGTKEPVRELPDESGLGGTTESDIGAAMTATHPTIMKVDPVTPDEINMVTDDVTLADAGDDDELTGTEECVTEIAEPDCSENPCPDMSCCGECPHHSNCQIAKPQPPANTRCQESPCSEGCEDFARENGIQDCGWNPCGSDPCREGCEDFARETNADCPTVGHGPDPENPCIMNPCSEGCEDYARESGIQDCGLDPCAFNPCASGCEDYAAKIGTSCGTDRPPATDECEEEDVDDEEASRSDNAAGPILKELVIEPAIRDDDAVLVDPIDIGGENVLPDEEECEEY